MKLICRHLPAGAILLGIVALGACSLADDFAVPKGLPAIKYPKDNAHSKEKVALGKLLYFDKRLSKDNTISCASCHDPAKGWSNGEATAEGIKKQRGGRSAPTIINSAYGELMFWDGRAKSLEDQALGPIQNPIEMGMSLDELISKLGKIEGYKPFFKAAFGDEKVTSERIAKAIAAYERTVISGDAPYDRFKAGDKKALSAAAERGRVVFFNKANCSACHTGPNFTDNSFHNIGIGMDKKKYDKGRVAISKLGGDTGSFKTPTLREIAKTAPYMHDGSLKTLEDVIKYYVKGGNPNEYLDEEIFKLDLTEQDQKDLAAFLKEGLSSPSYPNHKPPTLPK